MLNRIIVINVMQEIISLWFLDAIFSATINDSMTNSVDIDVKNVLILLDRWQSLKENISSNSIMSSTQTTANAGIYMIAIIQSSETTKLKCI